MSNAFSDFSSVLGIVLLRFVWQGALIGLSAWLMLRLLRNAKPQLRYAVACISLLGCVLLPLWQIATLGADQGVAAAAILPSGRDVSAGSLFYLSAFSATPALSAPPGNLLRWIVLLWALGAGGFSLRMAGGLWWVHRLRADASDCGAPEWRALQSQVDRLARHFGLTRIVTLRLIAHGDSPLSAGWIKPVLLFPTSLALRLPLPLIEALIAHELAHIRRHDYLINLIQSAIEVLLFYHPVVWWLSRQIRNEREQVADQLAAEALGSPRRLAAALFEIEKYSAPIPSLLQFANGGHLMTRIQNLVRPGRRSIAGGLVLPLLGLSFASFALYANANLDSPKAPISPAVQPASSTATSADPIDGERRNDQARKPASAAGFEVSAVEKNHQATKTPRTQISILKTGEGSFGIVRKDREGILMSGQLDDVDILHAMRGAIADDFIWYRRNGQDQVIRDAAMLTRAGEIWKSSDELNQKMQALEVRMHPHQQKLDAIQKRMDQLTRVEVDEAQIEQASTEIQALSTKQRDLAIGREKLERALERAHGARRDKIRQEISDFEQSQHDLNEAMDRKSKIIDAQTSLIDDNSALFEPLAREMEVATAPMQGIGREMEVLGKQIERTADTARARMHQLIDEAEKQGLSERAPGFR